MHGLQLHGVSVDRIISTLVSSQVRESTSSMKEGKVVQNKSLRVDINLSRSPLEFGFMHAMVV